MSNQTPKRKAATISADGWYEIPLPYERETGSKYFLRSTQAVKFVSPQTKALKRQKTASFKEVLASPYRTPWYYLVFVYFLLLLMHDRPPISAEDQETLLALLKR